MNIGVHAHAAFKQQQTGVEHYAREILSTLLRLERARDHEWTLYTPIAPHRHLDPYLSSNAHHLPWPLPLGWTRLRLPLALRTKRPDVFFSPAHVLPRNVKASVVMIHGLEFEVIPEHYNSFHRHYLQQATKTATERATLIIAASESTRNDLIHYYDINPEKIITVHHGVGMAPRERMILPEESPPFFITIGRLEHKKNPEALIEAFEILADRGHPHHLVFLGGMGHGSAAIARRIANSPVSDRIVVTGFVSDQTKWAMLEKADVFIFPSHYEGFGFPVLEAQQVETPVVASNTSSLPEVVGDGGVLVTATPLGLVEAIEKVLNDASLRKNIISAGKKNIHRFSWKTAASKTLDVLERAVASY